MGDSSDFFATRGANRLIQIELVYNSGRKEIVTESTMPAAQKRRDELAKLAMIKSAVILKGSTR